MREEMYTEKDCISLEGQNLEGKVVVLNQKVLHPNYKKPEFQLWEAKGGFGCSPHTRGTAVWSKALEDGEETRWERYEFIGILKPELLEEYKQQKGGII